MCEREGEGETEKGRKRMKERERERGKNIPLGKFSVRYYQADLLKSEFNKLEIRTDQKEGDEEAQLKR